MTTTRPQSPITDAWVEDRLGWWLDQITTQVMCAGSNPDRFRNLRQEATPHCLANAFWHRMSLPIPERDIDTTCRLDLPPDGAPIEQLVRACLSAATRLALDMHLRRISTCGLAGCTARHWLPVLDQGLPLVQAHLREPGKLAGIQWRAAAIGSPVSAHAVFSVAVGFETTELVDRAALGVLGFAPDVDEVNATARAMEHEHTSDWHGLRTGTLSAHRPDDGPVDRCAACTQPAHLEFIREHLGPRLRVAPIAHALTWQRNIPAPEYAVLAAQAGLTIREAVTGWASCHPPRATAAEQTRLLARWRSELETLVALRSGGPA